MCNIIKVNFPQHRKAYRIQLYPKTNNTGHVLYAEFRDKKSFDRALAVLKGYSTLVYEAIRRDKLGRFVVLMSSGYPYNDAPIEKYFYFIKLLSGAEIEFETNLDKVKQV